MELEGSKIKQALAKIVPWHQQRRNGNMNIIFINHHQGRKKA
jgi:hypothetical protein